MAGNPAKNLRAAATDVERHIELVQPRRLAEAQAPLEERQRIKEKIKVRATGRKAMAVQQMGGKKRESRMIPAEGGGMGMGMNVD
jgi:large subunit ribosomal protein L24e